MQPGYPQQPSQPPPINNNMTMSIVSIFLFWPLAIPAIINASKVNPLLQQGDYNGAQHAANESRRWSRLAVIIGCVWLGIVLICCILGFVLNVGLFATSNSVS
jgi:Interferon-induced transmembrane protein